MSFLVATPDLVTAAASDLADIGSAIGAANAAAVVPTTGMLAAAADEVSVQIAAVFGAHAQGYQALSAQAAAFHDAFVRALSTGAASYTAAEAANASPLQAVEDAVLGVVNAPTQLLFGRPLIGDGTNGGTGQGPAGPADF
jgi:hypothetical protein